MLRSAARPAVTPFAAGATLAAAGFVLGAAPSLTARDAGELAAASFLLDVPHATGFPVDMAVLRLAELVPVGDVAFRANLCVGALTAVACGLAASLGWRLAGALELVGRWSCALAPVAVLMASRTVLRAATAVEVYASALALCLGALALLADEGVHEAPRRRRAALLAGLAVALHASARPAAALVLAILASQALRAGVRDAPRRLVPMAALGVVGAASIVYLPVAARRGGPIDWGHPASVEGLVRHLTAASIRRSYAGRMLVPWRIPEDLARAGELLLADLGPAVLLAAAVGAALALRDRLARVVVTLAAVDLAYAVAVNPMGMADRQTLFVTQACAALLAVVLVTRVGQLGPAGRRAAPVLGLGLVGAALVNADVGYAGRADGWSAPEIVVGALEAAPPRALVLCVSDDLCGGSLYAQWVEGERPDVTVLPQQHLADGSTWRRLELRRFGARVRVPAGGGDLRARRLRALVAAAGERLRWESCDGADEALAGIVPGSGETPVLGAPGGVVGAVDLAATRWVAQRVPASPGRGARWFGAVVLFSAARRVARADVGRAVQLWRAVLGLDPEHATAYTNLGVAASRAGELSVAVALTRRALDLDPERVTAWTNLARYLGALGDARGAAEAMEEARRRGR